MTKAVAELTEVFGTKTQMNGAKLQMYVFRELTDLSYPAIARLFGGRDHTTVIHAVDKTKRMMSERKQVFEQVTELVQKFKTS